MILYLKNWRINTNENLAAEIQNRKNAIMQIPRLCDPNLSDEEFMMIVAALYDWNKEDLESVAKEMLGVPKVHDVEMITNNIIFPSYLCSNNYFYNSVTGYSKKKQGLYKKVHALGKSAKYSATEIMEKVKNKELVLTKTRKVGDAYAWPTDKYGRRSSDDNVRIMMLDDLSHKVLQELEAYDLTKIDLSNLGVYESWLIPLFRSLFTPQRVRTDFGLALNISKCAFDVYENLYAKGNGSLESALQASQFLESAEACQEETTALLHA